jgi:hypothetical protein
LCLMLKPNNKTMKNLSISQIYDFNYKKHQRPCHKWNIRVLHTPKRQPYRRGCHWGMTRLIHKWFIPRSGNQKNFPGCQCWLNRFNPCHFSACNNSLNWSSAIVVPVIWDFNIESDAFISIKTLDVGLYPKTLTTEQCISNIRPTFRTPWHWKCINCLYTLNTTFVRIHRFPPGRWTPPDPKSFFYWTSDWWQFRFFDHIEPFFLYLISRRRDGLCCPRDAKVVELILFVSNVFCWMLRFPQRVVNLSWIFVFQGSRNWQFCFFQRLKQPIVHSSASTYCKTLTLDWIIVRPNRLRAKWTTSIGMIIVEDVLKIRRCTNSTMCRDMFLNFACLRSLIGSSMIPKSGGPRSMIHRSKPLWKSLCFTVSKCVVS